MTTKYQVQKKTWEIKARPGGTDLIDWLYRLRDTPRHPTESLLSRDPHLLFGMPEALKRITEALKEGHKITIHGDYDVDGITSATTLYLGLQELGAEDINVFLPDRIKDGYGLKMHTIEKLIKEKTRLLITVDCGISNFKEIEFATNNGLDVIVIDHHNIPDTLPPATAVINPKLARCPYPFDHLCACGVVLKTIQALGGNWQKYLDLAAIATVADCMPLINENREIVTQGLQRIRQNPRPGIKAILNSAGIDPKDVSSTTIGFQIGPRINAAGRISSPQIAFETLKTYKEDDAIFLSQKLQKLNLKRREMVRVALKEAVSQVDLTQSILIAKNENWHPGIVGLIAGRLSNNHGKPALAIHGKEDHMVGSARSIPGLNITETIGHASELLEAFGGHSEAAGFTVKPGKYDEFKNLLEKYTREKLAAEDLKPTLTIDDTLNIEDLSFILCDHILNLEPFGIGNPKPIFLFPEMTITKIQVLGKTQTHLKLTLSSKGRYINAIFFSAAELAAHINNGDVVDLAAHVMKNTWMGRSSLELEIKDLRFS